LNNGGIIVVMTHSNKDVCDQVIELLGKPRPINAQLLMNLIESLEEKPMLDYGFDRHWEYYFPRSGISLDYDNQLGIFDQLRLHLRTFDTEEYRPFAGNLPYGIDRDDSAEAVEARLPGSTMLLKDYQFDADLRPLVVLFVFTAQDYCAPGAGVKHLTMVTIDYVDAVRNPTKAASLGYDARRK
jgi:hypothetical protein